MATTERRTHPSLGALILAKGHEFELYQLIRLLLRLRSDRAPIGYVGPPDKEVLRLYGVHELASPAGTVKSVAIEPPYKRPQPSPVPVHVRTPSGLTDAYNPCSLPAVYVEQIRKALDIDRNPALAEFIDLFNHRLLSLEYRAWEKPRFYIRYERKPQGDLDRQTLSLWVYSLMGLGTKALAERLQIPDHVLLRYSAFFLPITRPAENLRRVLRDFFGVQTQVHEFRGKWCSVASNDRASLAGQRSRLGEGCMLGNTTWYQQASIRINLGPLSLDDFLGFLPGSRRFGEILEFANFYTRRGFEEFEIELTIARKDLPPCKLMTGKVPLRLGWVTWLGNDRSGETGDVCAVVFRSTEFAATLRYGIQESLMGIKRRLLNECRVRFSWTEEVVQSLMVSCRSTRSAPMRIAAIVTNLVEKKIGLLLEGLAEAPERVDVRASEGVLSFALR